MQAREIIQTDLHPHAVRALHTLSSVNRAIVLFGFAAAFAGLTFACSSGSSDTLKGGNAGDIANSTNAGDDDGNASSTPATTTTSTTQKTTSASSVQANAADAGTNPLAACDPAKTTTFEACAECCATKQPAVQDLNSCACGTGSKCADKCGDNLCTGGLPSIDCGVCLLDANCDFSNATTDTNTDDGEACLQQCASKQ